MKNGHSKGSHVELVNYFVPYFHAKVIHVEDKNISGFS